MGELRIAIITVGDCELVVLRRVHGARSPLELVCHTEMQRIDGHAQTPLQLARVDDRIDPDFNEELTLEVIERGSAVHCVSAYEGDIVIMGSDGVFDNLYLDEITELANNMLPPLGSGSYPPPALHALSQRIVELCHVKTRPMPNGLLPDAPIGRGGKKDDTSCVVAEVVEWTKELQRRWTPKQIPSSWPSWLQSMVPQGAPHMGSILSLDSCCVASYESDNDLDTRPEDLAAPRARQAPVGRAPQDVAQGLSGGGPGPRSAPGPQRFGPAAPSAVPRTQQAVPPAPGAYGAPNSNGWCHAPSMPASMPCHPQLYPFAPAMAPGSYVPQSWPGAQPAWPGMAAPGYAATGQFR